MRPTESPGAVAVSTLDRSRPAADARARRWDVASRTLAAVVGGYVATAVMTAFLARTLPLTRGDSTTFATLISFVIYAGLVLAVFGTRTTLRAWLAVLAPTGLFGALLLLLGGSS